MPREAEAAAVPLRCAGAAAPGGVAITGECDGSAAGGGHAELVAEQHFVAVTRARGHVRLGIVEK